jgi:uncharacterized protein (DUF58 family)
MGAGVLVQVLDPVELTLPYHGRIVFEGVATQDAETIHVPEAEEVAQSYCERIDAHCHAMEEDANARGWLYIRLSSDTDLAQALTAIRGELDNRREATG